MFGMGGHVVAHFQTRLRIERRVKKRIAGGVKSRDFPVQSCLRLEKTAASVGSM
jgi:hypothetical protein